MASGLDALAEMSQGSGTGLDALMDFSRTGRVPMTVSPPTSVGTTLRPFGVDTGIQMSPGASNFFAGAGKSLTDVLQGAGQMVGLSSRQDVLDKRAIDKSLMDTGAGKAGAVTGNIAAMIPTALIPGVNTMGGAAAVGAASGLLQPSASTGETAINTGLGAVAGPAALAAGRAVGALYQGGKALISPFFDSGQQAIAARALQASATDPIKAAANLARPQQLVPGSAPTTAQVALDPGLAQFERSLRSMPETSGPFQMSDAVQRSARLKALEGIAGPQDYYGDIAAGRRLFANEDYANAFKQGFDPQMAKAMAPQIQSLMERPSIQAAQNDAIRLAKENGVSLTDSSSLEGLDWLKKALDNKISIAANPGSSIGKEDLRALVQTKNDLMSVLDQISPAYKQANDNYAKMSGQVNSMDIAGELLSKLQQPGAEYMPGGGREMTSSFMRALTQAKDSVQKSTGLNRSITDVLPAGDMTTIENVARDLGRKAFVQDAGRAVGSNTAQNLASQNMLRRILGPTGLPQSWAESTLLQSAMRPYQWAAKAGEPRIQGLLASAMTDPNLARGLLTRAMDKPGALEQLGLLSQPYVPGLGLIATRPLASALSNGQ